MRREYEGRDLTKLIVRPAAERSSCCEPGQEIDETLEYLGAHMKEKVFGPLSLIVGGGGGSKNI